MRLALTILARLLGCRIVGHTWEVWQEPGHDPLLPVEHRVCAIASCQRHEVWTVGGWQRVG